MSTFKLVIKCLITSFNELKFVPHWEKYRIVMTILDPTETYFHIDNKRVILITIKQVITSVQIRYNLFYGCANKLYDC